MNLYCSVLFFVTRIKHEWLGNASTMRFAFIHPWMKILESWSKFGRPFHFVVTILFVTDRRSKNFNSATRTMLECLTVDPWSYFIFKWDLIFASCVLYFVKTTLADTTYYFPKATTVDFRTVTFWSSVRMTSMCSPMKKVLISTSIAMFLININGTIVTRWSILIYNVVLPLVLGLHFDANKSDVCYSLDICLT